MLQSANLSILDFVLVPFYLGIVYALAYRNRNKKYPKNHPWRKYYIPGLSVKIFGALFIGLIYAYYYGAGDTFYYFYHSQVINSAANESLFKWFNLLFHIPAPDDGNYYDYISQMEWYRDPAAYTVSAITAFVSAFTFNTYLPAAIIFAYISFSGVWALFRTFASLYPWLIKQIALAILFIPSVFIWGSGIFKDTVCIFGLGWLTFSVFRFLNQKDFSIKNIIIATLSFIIIAKIKLYILIAFIPALLMWVLFNYTSNITNKSLKTLVKFFFIAIVIGAFAFFMQKFGDELGKYSLDNVAQTSSVTRGYIHWVSGDEGSAYDLGEFDATSITSVLTKFPQAVNVTLFRPYLWESRKIIIFLSALESLLFLFVTLKIIFTVGPEKIWKSISTDQTIQFCLVFALIFAFAVGISSYNFGALSRYKIPCMPFYALAMILIYYKNMPAKKKLLPFL